MGKQVTIQLVLEWTFDKKDWNFSEKVREEAEKDPKIVLENDLVYGLYNLNDIVRPVLKDYKVTTS